MLLLLGLLLLATLAFSKRLAGTSSSFCQLQPDGQVYCAGSNADNRMGVGSLTGSNTIYFPTQMQDVAYAVDVCMADERTCIVDQNSAKCVGKNEDGSLGTGSSSSATVLTVLPGLENLGGGGVAQMFCGEKNGCALLNSGGARCWGKGKEGTNGDGSSTEKQYSPVTPMGFGDGGVMDISIGKEHVCLLTTEGKIFCQGKNDEGQVGDGTTDNTRRVPTAALHSVISDLTFSGVSCGEDHTCAVTMHVGALYCWGKNEHGELGRGSTYDGTNYPALVSGLSQGVRFVWASKGNTFAVLDSDGSAWAFGKNEKGVLGDGTLSKRSSPVRFAGGEPGILEVRGGGETTTCILQADQVVKCLGGNSNAQFGIGSTSSSTSYSLVERTSMADLPAVTDRPTPLPTTKAPTKEPTTRMPTTRTPTNEPTTRTPTTKTPTKAPTTKAPTRAPTTGEPTTMQPTSQRPTQSPTTPTTLVPTRSLLVPPGGGKDSTGNAGGGSGMSAAETGALVGGLIGALAVAVLLAGAAMVVVRSKRAAAAAIGNQAPLTVAANDDDDAHCTA